MPLPNVCRVGWYQRWTSFVPFSSSVPARNPSQAAWYPLSNSPPDFRTPSTFQAGEIFFFFFSKIHSRTICNEISRINRDRGDMYICKQREENRIFFLRRLGKKYPLASSQLCDTCATLSFPSGFIRSFRRYRGFSINTPTPGLEKLGAN